MMRIARATGLVLLIMVATQPLAAAKWDYTRWGMTPEQVAAAPNGAVHVEKKSAGAQAYEALASGRVSVGPFAMNASFGFDRTGGLARVTLTFADELRTEGLRAWLVQTYGRPKSTPPAGDDLGTWIWAAPDQDVVELMTDDDNPPVLVQHPP
jgi:hypothetical protein